MKSPKTPDDEHSLPPTLEDSKSAEGNDETSQKESVPNRDFWDRVFATFGKCVKWVGGCGVMLGCVFPIVVCVLGVVIYIAFVGGVSWWAVSELVKKHAAYNQEWKMLKPELVRMKAARTEPVTYTKTDPIYSEDINPNYVRVALDLELFEPDDYELNKVIDKIIAGGEGTDDLWRTDLLGSGEGDSSAFIIVRVKGSNVGYTDAVQRKAFFGRRVGISVDIPRKYVGREINVEIWDDDSDEQLLATFIASWKAKGNVEAGAEGTVGVPVAGNVGVNIRGSGTVEFDFNKFSSVMKNKDDLIVSADFKLVEGSSAELSALYMPAKITRTDLADELTPVGVERLVLETTARGHLVESVGMFYFPCGKVKAVVILPKEK